MRDYWVRALQAAEEAEEAARRLRRRYGPEAEAHVQDVVGELTAEQSREARARDVRRALRWT